MGSWVANAVRSSLDVNDDGQINIGDLGGLIARAQEVFVLIEGAGNVLNSSGPAKKAAAKALLEDAVDSWIGEEAIANPTEFKLHLNNWIDASVGMMNAKRGTVPGEAKPDPSNTGSQQAQA